MRLTLRTLLAYLDDTLDPGMTRVIGQKVAESETARDLIDRIKKVTRKRSLTVPPTAGPDKADANLVAEYLDNDLPSEKIAEVEEQALHSDVHLAEIAACHQLLTLILSEPAQVPPTARQRMYGLVQGREVDPARKAPRVAAATLMAESIDGEDEHHPLVSRSGGRKRLIAAGILTGLLAIAVWQATATRPAPNLNALVDANAPKPESKAIEDGKPKENGGSIVAANGAKEKAPAPDLIAKDKAADPPRDAPKEKLITPVDSPKDQKAKPEQPKEKGDPPKAVDPKEGERAAARKPSEDRKPIGKPAANGVLLTLSDTGWKRLPSGGDINGGARIMSLPGLSNELRIGESIAVDLWGTVPELGLSPPSGPIYESVVVAFAPQTGFDADLRLERGRIFLRAFKPAGGKIRLRLRDDYFDVTLPDDKSEAVADLTTVYSGEPVARELRAAVAPIAVAGVGVTRGTATVRPNLTNDAMLKVAPGLAVWPWNSKDGPAPKPLDVPEPTLFWAKAPNMNGPGREFLVEWDNLLKALPRQLGDGRKDLQVGVSELAYDRSPFGRRLGLYCHGALDDLKPLLDALEDSSNSEARIGAVNALAQWLGRELGNDQKLFDALVSQRGFTEAQAHGCLALWHGFSEQDWREPKTYAIVLDGLKSDRLAVRELSYWRIGQLDAEGARLIRYLPTDTADARQRAWQEWKRRIPDGSVPPRQRPQGKLPAGNGSVRT